MMNNILEELCYGNIDPNTQYFNKNSQYGKAMKIVSDNEKKLTELLEGTEKKLFLELINAQMEINGCTAISKFLYGFKLGFQIAVEASKEVSYDEN